MAGDPVRRVSIVGARGFIGSRLLDHLRRHANGRLEVSGTDRAPTAGAGLERLDLTDATGIEAHLARGFDLVVVAAGTKDVRRCEADPEWALALNATPLREMARIVARDALPTRIVGISTDYVFDGDRGHYDVGDLPAPRTRYGLSKLRGEEALLSAHRGHKVVRSGGVLGHGANFYDWLLAELAARREVRLFGDCYNSPTPVQLLVEQLLELLCAFDEVSDPIVHLVGDRRMSRLELGCAIARACGLGGSALVEAARPPGDGLFQRDLSLVPSGRFVQRATLEEYLSREARLR